MSTENSNSNSPTASNTASEIEKLKLIEENKKTCCGNCGGKEKHEYSWDETIKTLIIAVILAVIFRSFFFEPFHIPSGSMKNTLLVGDYIFVSKYSYGYSRYSFPWGLPLFEGRIFDSNKPERGDIVVFRKPSNPRIDFIKRIVGLPNDKIQMRNGVLYINGVAVKRKRIEDYVQQLPDGTIKHWRQYEETLPNGKTYRTLDMTQMSEVDNTAVYNVPEGHYFVMGDNRDNSTDSRYINEVGFIPAENLIGRAEIIFFSQKNRFLDFSSWKDGIFRSGRFFKTIE